MIIIKLQGGLGNQMFQYALGRNLSLLTGALFKIDSSYLRASNQSKRTLEIHAFDTRLMEATKEEIQTYTSTVQKILDRLRPESQKKKVLEHTNAFNQSILKRNDGYFDGHWNNEQYFVAHEAEIREDFRLKGTLTESALQIWKQITTHESSIGLHIRRGDYVSLGKVAATLGVLPLSYYENAMEYMTEKFPTAHFFVFSDDITWAEENLPKKYPLNFVSQENISNPEDLTLMSFCKHAIIANSTFSWWGAWLNGNPNKIVIAPKKWHVKEELNKGFTLPPTWIQL